MQIAHGRCAGTSWFGVGDHQTHILNFFPQRRIFTGPDSCHVFLLEVQKRASVRLEFIVASLCFLCRCTLQNAIVCPNAYIHERCSLKDCQVAKRATVPANSEWFGLILHSCRACFHPCFGRVEHLRSLSLRGRLAVMGNCQYAV